MVFAILYFKIDLGFYQKLEIFSCGIKLQFFKKVSGGTSDFPTHRSQSCLFPFDNECVSPMQMLDTHTP